MDILETISKPPNKVGSGLKSPSGVCSIPNQNSILNWAVNFIFPKNCLECKKNGVYMCQSCTDRVGRPKSVCSECNKASIDGFTHIKCQKKYGINGLIALWDYDGIIRKAILALKYKYATELSKEIVNYAITEIKNSTILNSKDFCLTPVPLHWYKENVRGFNQSSDLGKRLACEMKWKYIPDLLIRKKYTVSQATLKRKNRQQNIKGVFGINNKYLSLFTTRNPLSILVFDDVYTTGSTLKEVVKTLKRASVEKVWGLTIAR